MPIPLPTARPVAPPPHDPSVPFRGTTKPPAPPKKAAPKPTNTPTGTATGPTPPIAPPLTEAQQIAQWVQATQLPQMQAITDAENASHAQETASATQTQGYYKALAQLLSTLGPETQGTYAAASGAQAAFGKGFSDGLANVQTQMQGQSNDALGVAGAPASQAADVTQSIGGTGATDALYASGGYIPATDLNREGAAFTAAANMLPASAAGEGAQSIQNLIAASNTADQGFNQQRSDLAAQVPGLALQYQSQLATQAAAKQDYAEKVREFNVTQRETAIRQQQTANYQTDTLKLRQDQLISDGTYKKLALAQNVNKENDLQTYRSAEIALKQDAARSAIKIVGNDKTGYYSYNPSTGQKMSILPPAPTVGAKASAAQVRKATSFIYQAKQGYYAYSAADMKPLTMTQLHTLAKGQNEDISKFLGDANALTKAGLGYYQYNDVKGMKAVKQDKETNQYYLSLINDFGLNRQQAFDVTAKAYPAWGARNRKSFFPKGEASQGDATPGSSIANTALTQLGEPYQWGGLAKLGSPTDCSGLLQASAAANGINIGRTTYEQWTQGAAVPLDKLQPGDAVFFDMTSRGPGHVAIYIGNGRVVEDPHTGASVEISRLAGRGPVGARRY